MVWLNAPLKKGVVLEGGLFRTVTIVIETNTKMVPFVYHSYHNVLT